MNKEQFKKLGEMIEYNPYGNAPYDYIDGVFFTMKEYKLIYKALFGDEINDP